MHGCPLDDPGPCNAWCQEDLHTDLTFTDRHFAPMQLVNVLQQLAHTSGCGCVILSARRVTETPTTRQRYPNAQWATDASHPYAYLVTYLLKKDQTHGILRQVSPAL